MGWIVPPLEKIFFSKNGYFSLYGCPPRGGVAGIGWHSYAQPGTGLTFCGLLHEGMRPISRMNTDCFTRRTRRPQSPLGLTSL